MLAWLLAKVIMKSSVIVQKQDIATKTLKCLFKDKKCRLIWPTITKAGEDIFRDAADEFAAASDWDTD